MRWACPSGSATTSAAPNCRRTAGTGSSAGVGWLDTLAGRVPTHLSALEITVAPRARGAGLATRLLEALRASASDAGLSGHVAPVRPSRRHLEPTTPMVDYAARTRPDGLPEDPCLRLHVREGARVPLHVDLVQDHAVHVEPNVWVRHQV